jgi:hypothetical protein
MRSTSKGIPIFNRMGIWQCAILSGVPTTANSRSEGPRESPTQGRRDFPAEEQGRKVRLRPRELCRPLQPRAFYISQTPPEQRHIASASPAIDDLVKELTCSSYNCCFVHLVETLSHLSHQHPGYRISADRSQRSFLIAVAATPACPIAWLI